MCHPRVGINVLDCGISYKPKRRSQIKVKSALTSHARNPSHLLLCPTNLFSLCCVFQMLPQSALYITVYTAGLFTFINCLLQALKLIAKRFVHDVKASYPL